MTIKIYYQGKLYPTIVQGSREMPAIHITPNKKAVFSDAGQTAAFYPPPYIKERTLVTDWMQLVNTNETMPKEHVTNFFGEDCGIDRVEFSFPRRGKER